MGGVTEHPAAVPVDAIAAGREATSRDTSAAPGRLAARSHGCVPVGELTHATDRFRRLALVVRRLALVGFSLIYVAYPLSALLHSDAGPVRKVVMTSGLVAVIVLFASQNVVSDEAIAYNPVPYVQIGALAVLAAALAVVGGGPWVLILSFAAAVVALRCPPRLVVGTLAGCAALSAVRLSWSDMDLGGVLLQSLVPVVIGGFSFNARSRISLAAQLQATQHELARVAVAEERLRIARDLHDLLGHSLSLIAVKTELARRVLPIDPERAAREINDVESVARRALGEVRNAVTNYRRPTVAAELASARRALASAGIVCVIDTPQTWDLPDDVDALLAWTVREGCTNVIRHSRARHATVRLVIGPNDAEVQVRDDGTGALAESEHCGGNGLAGLSERAARLGGQLEAGAADECGFLLRVRVPR